MGSSAAPSCARAPGSTIGPPPRTDGRSWPQAVPAPAPAGFAFLAQDIDADDYRGRTVTFRAELRTAEGTAAPGWHSAPAARADPRHPGRPAQIPGTTRGSE